MKRQNLIILFSLLMSMVGTKLYATEDVEIQISSGAQVRVYCTGEYGGGETIIPFSWSSIIHQSISALGGNITEEEFENGWTFTGTQYSSKDVLKSNPIGQIYLAPEVSEEGVVWIIDDNTIINLASQGKVDRETGLLTEAISTMVKIEGSPNIWVALTIPAGCFQFATGRIYTNKVSSYWYSDNCAAINLPNSQIDNYSFKFDVLSIFEDISHFANIYWFQKFNEEAMTTFRFTSPAIAKGNATFDADYNGQWNVNGASGKIYTLRVSADGLRIETTDGIPIVRLTGDQNNITEYQDNTSALDILNYVCSTKLGSNGTFMAYMEIVVESCYEMFVTDNSQYFNLRFQRSVVFEDAVVKALCVAKWDTNGDGGLTEAELASVKDLGDVFRGNESITTFDELRYFTGLTAIGDYAFAGCRALKSIQLPECVTSIREGAFESCCSLNSVNIPERVTSIGEYAFGECSSLASFTIPNGVTSINDFTFFGCSGLTSISIPVGVTNIGYHAFIACSSLTTIDIPMSVTSIGEEAFEECTSLVSVIIPSKVSNIGVRAFSGCTALASISIPSSLTAICDGTFEFCSSLTSVTIPSSVTAIGDYAFDGCNSLASVTVERAEPLTISSEVFYNRANAILNVPSGSKAAYEAAEYWNEFKEIVEYGVPEIEKYTLEVYGDVGIDLNESHLYDRDGNEYDYIGSGDNEFDEGSYIRISPFVGASLYIQEIIVNGESVGTWTEDNAPTEYVIESLSENTTVEFKTYLRAQWRTLGCVVEGPGKVEMYKNGNLIGTASSPDNYFSDVFECGDIIKLVLVPDAGSTLTQFLGGEYGSDEALGENLLGEITDNAYSFTFNPDDIVNKYGYLVRFFKAIFEVLEPTTANTLSSSVPTLLIGKQATLSLNLTNEDELIAFEFDLQLPDGITIAKDEDNDPIAMLSSRASKHSLAVSDQGNGLYHFLCYSNTNKIISGSEGELLSIELLCDENTAVGTYQATVKNIIFSDVGKNKITPADVTFDLEVIEAEPGDVNKDGEINVMDVVEMVAYIMGDGAEGFVFAAADLYPDGAINVMDLVNLVDLIMNSSASNAREWTDNSMSLSALADGVVSVKVNNPEQYVASEFIVEVSAGQTLETVTADKHHRVTCSQLDDSHYKVMTYSSANSTFNSDALVQLHISGEGMVNVHDALLVDESRKGVAFAPAVGGYTTGINQMENGKLIIENSSVYDLQGKKRDTSRPYRHEVLIVNGKKQVVR